MGTGSAPRLRCPDCLASVGPLEERVVCGTCGRAFAPDDGVWDLLPGTLDAPKTNEDTAHVDDLVPTWRRLFFHKSHWIDWCDRRWLPELIDGRTRSFLEIGGGLCYASALAKARAPGAHVVATDVSPRYLRRHARRVGEILGGAADTYAAVDAEHLPFDDGQFDAVYSQVVLYRLPDPARALHEIWRVLAPGGRFLGVERASPWSAPSLARETRAMRERSVASGVLERPLRYRDWRAIIDAAGVPAQLATVAGRRVRSPWLRRLENAVRPVHVTIGLAR
jgi:SAM-dependent methyltransferase